MVNEIYLRRKNKLILNTSIENTPRLSYIATINKNIEDLGYTLSENVINVLKTYTIEDLEQFYLCIVKELKQSVGVNKKYSPMYPNFPKQVMEASEVELYLNAIIHYFTFGQLLPEYEKEERLPLFDNVSLKVINLGNEEDFNDIFKNLLQSKTSLSETDKNDIGWFFNIRTELVEKILPTEIPLKENVALVAKLIIQNDINHSLLFNYFKTATDVLRLCVALSDGDISLATNTKFISFKRKERRLILSLLENCGNIEEDMKRYKNRWIRLGERLHPSEYKNSYQTSQLAFSKLRNNEKIETFNGKVETAFNESDFNSAIDLLKTRSGEFARRLDYLLRNHHNPNVVINEFEKIVSDISTPVLLQVMEHFKQRNNNKEIRSFFPKGNVAKVYAINNELPNIDENVCRSIIKICESALINSYKEKEYLGKVYIDEQLKNYIIPFSQRSTSKSLKTIVRGSKLDIKPDTKTIRPFVYWKEGNDRVDIDLSIVMYDDKWNYLEHVSYTNLRSSKYNVYHSGDITSAPNGASEFIDLDIKSVKKYSGRFVVVSLHTFTEQNFVEVPECFMGWMSREYPNSGEIYEPKTVENKIDLASNSKIGIPMILDLHENKVIWTDIALRSNPNYYNNVEGNKFGIALMGKVMTNLVKPNLYDLFKLHAVARGELCDNIEDADIVFSVNQGITPFDQDVIVSQYL